MSTAVRAGFQGLTLQQIGSLRRFWLWAAIGVFLMFGSISFGAGGVTWPLEAACIGMLAARALTPRRAGIAVALGIAAPLLMLVLDSSWPLVAGIAAALAVPLVHTRRDAIVLAAGLVCGTAALLALNQDNTFLPVILAPALVVLVALATGRPQREAAGALTGAGLVLFAFGALPAISLILAGAILMVTLGLRRRRLTAAAGA
jgi:hypothetical protein